jgi:carbon storage regulator
VTLGVLSASGAEARLGVEAPESVRVYRKELWSAVREANVSAAGWSAAELAALATDPDPDGPGTDEPASAGTAGP